MGKLTEALVGGVLAGFGNSIEIATIPSRAAAALVLEELAQPEAPAPPPLIERTLNRARRRALGLPKGTLSLLLPQDSVQMSDLDRQIESVLAKDLHRRRSTGRKNSAARF